MVKQPADHSSEFQMSNEDFPALPGAPAAEPGSSNSILESVKLPTAGLTPEQVSMLWLVTLVDIFTLALQEMAKTAQARKGIQTSPDGELTRNPLIDVENNFFHTFVKCTMWMSDIITQNGKQLKSWSYDIEREFFSTLSGPLKCFLCWSNSCNVHLIASFGVSVGCILIHIGRHVQKQF